MLPHLPHTVVQNNLLLGWVVMKDSPRETSHGRSGLSAKEQPGGRTYTGKEDQTFLVLPRFREGTKPSIPPLEGGHSAREFLVCVTKSSNLYTCLTRIPAQKHSQGRNL